MPPHPLTNFEIQMYYQNKPRVNGVYSRDDLPDKIKDGEYVTNLDEHCYIALGLRIFQERSKNLPIKKT